MYKIKNTRLISESRISIYTKYFIVPESDKYLCDASYFRIKNVTLSYTFPKPVISKLLLRQLKAFVSIENLATFSSLPKGIDPETLTWDYPAFRTVSFGINVTL